MKTIIYKFCDGSTNSVEVSDEFYAVHVQLVREEKSNNKRETRRHISLNYLNDLGMDIEDKDGDMITANIRKEDATRLNEIMEILTDRQRKIVHKAFYENMGFCEIAKQMGLSHQAIYKQMAIICKKLKKFF